MCQIRILDIFLRDNLLNPQPEKTQAGLFNPLMAPNRKCIYAQYVEGLKIIFFSG